MDSPYVRLDDGRGKGDGNAKKANTQSPASLQKTDVLQWLQQSTESDVVWVLRRLFEASPRLLESATEGMQLAPIQENVQLPVQLPSGRRLTLAEHTEYVAMRGITPRMEGLKSDFSRDLPIIQFAAPVFYAEEGTDDIMYLDVMRFGNLEGSSEVAYNTEDGSALAGRQYHSTKGTLIFGPGSALMQIKVKMVDNDLWDTTTEFRVHLKTDGLKGAALGQYLKHTTVRVIDNDSFPSNKYSHLTSAQKVDECSKWPLMFAFFRLVANIPKVWNGTVKWMLVDVVHGLTYLFKLYMNVYMLDYVVVAPGSHLAEEHPESELLFVDTRLKSLLAIVGVGVVDIAIAHLLEYKRLGFSITGPTRNFLQNALLRTFLNYKRLTHEDVSNGDVLAAIERDANDLVNVAYINILKVFKVVFQLTCIITFKVTAPMLFGSTPGYKALAYITPVPIVLMTFLLCRERSTSKALKGRNKSLKDFTNQVSVTTTKYNLVMDYALRFFVEKLFLKRQGAYSKANRIAQNILLHNQYFCTWCQFAVVSFWTIYGGTQVIGGGDLSVGLFVTNLSLFKDLGSCYSDLYTTAVQMMNAFPALTNVTTLMNLQVDVRQRCRLTKLTQEQAKKRREKLRQEVGQSSDVVPIDLLPIVMNFPTKFRFEGKSESLNFYGQVQIRQGQMVAVVGPLGAGKATLLNLVVGTVLPADGKGMPLGIFVPPHLRVVNVADQALFFNGTLYESLTFGMDESEPDAARERVRSICWRLTQSETIIDYLDKDHEGSWADLFSCAQCKLLSIARGLINNPDVMCIHKPLATLTHDDQEHVVAALREHIAYKGLEISLEPARRRPRTIIVSAASDRAIDEADNVVVVNPASGIRLLHAEPVHPDPNMMGQFGPGDSPIPLLDPNGRDPRSCGDCPAQ